jgi:3-dehydroquinate synthase
MLMASALSVEKGFLTEAEHQRLKTLLEKIGLPAGLRVNKESVLDALGKDKKREGEAIHFVLLNAIGKASVVEISLNGLRESIESGRHIVLNKP